MGRADIVRFRILWDVRLLLLLRLYWMGRASTYICCCCFCIGWVGRVRLLLYWIGSAAFGFRCCVLSHPVGHFAAALLFLDDVFRILWDILWRIGFCVLDYVVLDAVFRFLGF